MSKNVNIEGGGNVVKYGGKDIVGLKGMGKGGRGRLEGEKEEGRNKW